MEKYNDKDVLSRGFACGLVGVTREMAKRDHHSLKRGNLHSLIPTLSYS
jgi:hypothetical protein